VKPKLTLITGMPGSGKTTLADLLRERGYRVMTMGDVIRAEAERRGLTPSPATLGQVAQALREEGGESVIAERCCELLGEAPQPLQAIDGIRSMREVETFRKHFQTLLVAVHASPSTRFKRLKARGRSDDPQDPKVFHQRDARELGFGVGEAIALADIMLVNEGSVEDLHRSASQALWGEKP